LPYLTLLTFAVSERQGEEAFFVSSGGQKVQIQADLNLLTKSLGTSHVTFTGVRKVVATANQHRDAPEVQKNAVAESMGHQPRTQKEHYQQARQDQENFVAQMTVRGLLNPKNTQINRKKQMDYVGPPLDCSSAVEEELNPESECWMFCTTCKSVISSNLFNVHMRKCENFILRSISHGPQASCNSKICPVCSDSKHLVNSLPEVMSRGSRASKTKALKQLQPTDEVDMDINVDQPLDVDYFPPTVASKKNVGVQKWIDVHETQSVSERTASSKVSALSLSSTLRNEWTFVQIHDFVLHTRHFFENNTTPTPKMCESIRRALPNLSGRKAQVLYIKFRQLQKKGTWREYL
jgi:hypothetical protein